MFQFHDCALTLMEARGIAVGVCVGLGIAFGAGIIESEKFDSLNKQGGIHEATQSGPLLVIDGEVNHNLKSDSRSLYVRNGIGVKSAAEVYILISEDEVSL